MKIYDKKNNKIILEGKISDRLRILLKNKFKMIGYDNTITIGGGKKFMEEIF